MFNEQQVIENRIRFQHRINDHTPVHIEALADCLDYLETLNIKPKTIIVDGYCPKIDDLQALFPRTEMTYFPTGECNFSTPCDLFLSFGVLHYKNDPIDYIKKIHETLRPGGFVYCVFPGEYSLLELNKALTNTEISLRGGASPRIIPMIFASDALTFLQVNSFKHCLAHTASFSLVYDTLHDALNDIRYSGNGNALLQRSKTLTPKLLFQTTERSISFPFSLSFDLVILTGSV